MLIQIRNVHKPTAVHQLGRENCKIVPVSLSWEEPEACQSKFWGFDKNTFYTNKKSDICV